MNLLFSINQKFIPLWEQCMATILRHGGAVRYDVYVLHSDLTAEDGARMRAARRRTGHGCAPPSARRTAVPW